MLRVTLTLVPRGDERRAKDLGTIEIENDGEDTDGWAYIARMRGAFQADAKVRGVDRGCGPWRVVAAALKGLLDG